MFKINELVLVKSDQHTFIPRKVVGYSSYNPPKYLLSNGYYSTEYSEDNIHKCPASIKRLIKEEGK